jgi:hypothetical protein
MVNSRPLLFLDVDGPLNPYSAKSHRRPEGYLTHRMRLPGLAPNPYDRTKPLRVWLNPDHGAHLLALPYDLVWATTWMHDANVWIGPEIGLPDLPVVTWPQMHQTDPDGVHWKTRHLVEQANGRPFAWVDDEITERDHTWVAANHDAPALLHRIDPRLGLREPDFVALLHWSEPLNPVTDGKFGQSGGSPASP